MEAAHGVSEGGRDALGFIGGGILALSMVPQIVQLLMTKSAADISLMWSLLYFLGTALSFVYLLILGALAAWIPVALELVACIITVSLKILYDYTAWGQAQQKQRQQEQFKAWQEQYLATLNGISQDGALDPAAGSPAGDGDMTVALTVEPRGKSLIQSTKAVQSEAPALHSSGAARQAKPWREAHTLNSNDGEVGLNLFGSTAGLVTPAAAAAAAAMSFASFSQQQNRASRWYSQTGIRHGAAVTAAAPPVNCCHVCGAPQIAILRSRDSSHAGGNAASFRGGLAGFRGSLPGVGTLNNAFRSSTAGFRRSLAGFRGSLAGALPSARWDSTTGLGGSSLVAQDTVQQEEPQGSPRTRFAPKNKAQLVPPPAEQAVAKHAPMAEVHGKHGPVTALPNTKDPFLTADKYGVPELPSDEASQGVTNPRRPAVESARRSTSDSIDSSIDDDELSLSVASTPDRTHTGGGVSDHQRTQDGVISRSNSGNDASSRLVIWTNAVFSNSESKRETRRSTDSESEFGGNLPSRPAMAVAGLGVRPAGQDAPKDTARAAAALATPTAATAGEGEPAAGHAMHQGGQRRRPGAGTVDSTAARGTRRWGTATEEVSRDSLRDEADVPDTA